jgi:protein O-GlcNAc transferase
MSGSHITDSHPAESKIANDIQASAKSSQIQRELQLALKRYESGDLKKAESIFEKILKIDPENADALHLLGMIAYQSGKSDRAINLIRRAVSSNSAQPMLYNNLGYVFLAEGDLGDAVVCFKQAIRLEGRYADAYCGLGKALHLQGHLDEAIEAYNKVLLINPEMTDTIINLGQAFYSKGAIDKAVACCRRVNFKNPDNLDANLLLASAYLGQEKAELAKSHLRKVLAKEPNNVDALFKFALAEEKLDRLENALAGYQRIIELNPNLPEVFINIGRLYKTRHELNKAMECYQTALILNPAIAELQNNVGTIQLQLGEYSEAQKSFRKALEISPNYVSALHNLGNTFQKMGLLEEAIDCYRKTLIIEPDFIPAHYHLGLIYQTQKEHEQAIDCFRKALFLNPDYTNATCYLYHQLQYLCDWKELDDLGARIDSATLDSLKNSRKPNEVPFLSISRRIDPAMDYEIAKAWSAEIDHRAANAPGSLSAGVKFTHSCRASKKKIIVGYLSNNFKNHPTGHLLSGMFRHHNRDDFAIYCYSFGEDDKSEFRKQIQSECDRFIEIGTLSYSEAARHIHHDKVDILVDLVGFTHGHRMQIAAMRPAPIQVRWLGMAGTTGADFFDYIILDSIVVPQDHAEFYSEQLVLMPHCYQVNNRDQDIAQNSWSKEDMGLPENAFVFCCFCSRYKLDPIIFDAWLRILNKNSRSVLWLMGGNKTAGKNLKKYAQVKGVRSDRLVFAFPLPKAEHLSRLQHADIVLDTHIVNGAATTSDALWAGVPVLTLQGSHFASRMSSSILTAIGLPELITYDLKTYETLAVRLAQNSEGLNSIRKKLAENRLTQPLFDTHRFITNLESAYKEMRRIFLAGEKPRQIKVIEN